MVFVVFSVTYRMTGGGIVVGFGATVLVTLWFGMTVSCAAGHTMGFKVMVPASVMVSGGVCCWGVVLGVFPYSADWACAFSVYLLAMTVGVRHCYGGALCSQMRSTCFL